MLAGTCGQIQCLALNRLQNASLATVIQNCMGGPGGPFPNCTSQTASALPLECFVTENMQEVLPG